MGTLIIYKLSSRKFATQNDLYQQYSGEHVVTLIETDCMNDKCLRMRFDIKGLLTQALLLEPVSAALWLPELV